MKELDEDLISSISDYQFKLSELYSEYSEFLRQKGYRCGQINGLVYHIHPDYYEQWINTRSYKRLPTGAIIQF